MQKKTLTPGCAGLRMLAVFLSVSMVSSDLQISPDPLRPRVGQTVILNVIGIPENVRFYNWYRGNDISAENQILSYDARNRTKIDGRRFFKEAEIQNNGSLKIVNVVKEFQDKYTLALLPNVQPNKEVYLEVDDSPTPKDGNPNPGLSGGAIAGIVIAVIVVAIAAILGGLYAFKFNKSG